MPSPYQGNPANADLLVATITGVTLGPMSVVTTAAAHGFYPGDNVFIFGVGGVVGVNNEPITPWLITVTGTHTFTLSNAAAFTGSYTSGGTVYDLAIGPPITIPSDGDTFNAAAFNVAYRALADRTQLLELGVSWLGQGWFTGGVYPSGQTFGFNGTGMGGTFTADPGKTGVIGTGGAGNQGGGLFVGSGTGNGLHAVGGASGGSGITATGAVGGSGGVFGGGTANGVGVYATAGGGNADGLVATGAGTGYGAVVQAGTTADATGLSATGNGRGAGATCVGGNGTGIFAGTGCAGTGGTYGLGGIFIGGASSPGGCAGQAGTGSNGWGLNGSGDGSGAGVVGQGGASGPGGTFTAGTNADGVYGAGGGTFSGVKGLGGTPTASNSNGGAGVLGTGGTATGTGDDGIGGKFTGGGTNGQAVTGQGQGTGTGGSFVGGTTGTGVYGGGGSTSGYGVHGEGGGTYPGGKFDAGAAGNPSVIANEGPIQITNANTPNLASNTVPNAVYPDMTIKAAGNLSTDGSGGVTLRGTTRNVSVSIGGSTPNSYILVQFGQPMADANYVVVCGGITNGGSNQTYASNYTSGGFRIIGQGFDPATQAFGAGVTPGITFLIAGAQ